MGWLSRPYVLLAVVLPVIVVMTRIKWFDPNWRHQLSNSVISYVVLALLGGTAAYVWTRQNGERPDAATPTPDVQALTVVPRLPVGDRVFPLVIEIRNGPDELRDLDVVCNFDQIGLKDKSAQITDNVSYVQDYLQRIGPRETATAIFKNPVFEMTPEMERSMGYEIETATVTIRVHYTRTGTSGRGAITPHRFRLHTDRAGRRRWDQIE